MGARLNATAVRLRAAAAPRSATARRGSGTPFEGPRGGGRGHPGPPRRPRARRRPRRGTAQRLRHPMRWPCGSVQRRGVPGPAGPHPTVPWSGEGDDFVRGSCCRGKCRGGGGISPPLQTPKLCTASRTHCTAKAPRVRQGKISPPSLKTRFSHEKIPARHYPPRPTLPPPPDTTPPARHYPPRPTLPPPPDTTPPRPTLPPPARHYPPRPTLPPPPDTTPPARHYPPPARHYPPPPLVFGGPQWGGGGGYGSPAPASERGDRGRAGVGWRMMDESPQSA